MPQPDTEKFRLRSFVERLVQQGHCVVHDDPEIAMQRARKQVGFYVSHPSSDSIVAFKSGPDLQLTCPALLCGEA